MPQQIASGQRDKLVQIESGTAQTSATGFPLVSGWASLGRPVYMSRRDISADERFVASQDTAWGRVGWQMPYQANMDPELVDVTRLRRLNFKGRIFNIEAAFLMERRIGIELITLAKVD